MIHESNSTLRGNVQHYLAPSLILLFNYEQAVIAIFHTHSILFPHVSLHERINISIFT